MSRKFKSQASSARAASGFGGLGSFQTAASPLSYIAEQPDLSQISEPNVVVAFKNLGKKDSTTKAKALDELIENAKSHDDLAVLTAWSDLYPRTSIDSSQIVRRNAHALQGQLTAKAGKKIAPFLPKIIPSWLAGTLETDKSVARAASEALDQAFPTPEKKMALWKIYKDSIYERIEDALLVQTATTLSDERTTSPDEAETKYVRVVGTALRLLGQLVAIGLDRDDILAEEKLWNLAHYEDSSVRNAVCDLLLTVLSKDGDNHEQNWTVLSTAFLYKALNKNQTGSARVYAQVLCKMTEIRPSIWASDYTAKTAASKRLLQYLRQGSQSGPQDIWTMLARLVRLVPVTAWKKSDEDISTFAEAYRSGVLKERLHIDAAWQSYLTVCSWLCGLFTTQDARNAFLEKDLMPLVVNYVNKTSDENWRNVGRSERTASLALDFVRSQSLEAHEKLWSMIIDDTIEKMRLSLPESSKDFRSSQEGVIAQGKRLLSLQQSAGDPHIDGIQAHNTTLLHAAIDLLKSRNGKPYGAASIVNNIASLGGKDDDKLKHFVQHDLEILLSSPSSEQLVALALQTGKPIGQVLLEESASSSAHTIRGIEFFFRTASQTDLEKVQPIILSKIGGFHSETDRALALALLANTNLRGSSIRAEVLSHLVATISTPETQVNGLSMLETMAVSPSILQEIASSEIGHQLTSKLLVLADSADTSVSERANALSSALNSRRDAATSSLPIIRQQLSGQGDAISILTLTDLGLKSSGTIDVHELLPEAEDWNKALQPHLGSSPQASLSITSPLQGAVWIVSSDVSSSRVVLRDAEDFSLLFRIVFFVTKALTALEDQKLFASSSSRTEALCLNYPVALQLVNEKVTLDSANDIWLGSTDEVLSAAADLLSEGGRLLSTWQQEEAFSQYWLTRGHEIQGLSRRSYYETLAFISVVSHAVDREPKAVIQRYESELQNTHKSSEILRSSALLSATGEHLLNARDGLRIVNELIADITSAPSGFFQVVYLNILLKANSTILEKVPQQRLVFLFQKVVNFLREEADGANLLSENFVLVSHVIPFVQDIFGEHWETLVAALIDVWEFLAADDVALLHSSLLAYAQLRRALKADDVNDDLIEAISESKALIHAGLLHCLRALSNAPTEIDQPRSITAELLRRQLSDVSVKDGTELFMLLGSEIPGVRNSAFDLLHKMIPEAQEQRSIDLALDQKYPQLPDELLRLLQDSTNPQSYTLSWKLVFDHYPKASHKLQEAYTANIRATGHVATLLVFLCERLRITSGRPLDASKFDVAEYSHGVSESDELSLQWLCVHLYYLALTYLPSLVKDWFLEQKNKIKTPLENWTEKFITPFIVQSSLAIVTEWASSQSQDADDRPVDVKTSPRGSEVIASIKVDPESPPISLAITLPSVYPLQSPSVNPRTRVGVSEKNFTSWLRTIQIIIFSSGSIIEGLIAFRRNVQGALKGQTECAICYSIIGTDMQTPNKKCGTCKNMFHGACLFRWFKSSNSSSCPLCRNNFNYA